MLDSSVVGGRGMRRKQRLRLVPIKKQTKKNKKIHENTEVIGRNLKVFYCLKNEQHLTNVKADTEKKNPVGSKIALKLK